MPDSQETKVLKDINRHLADISEKGTATDTLSPSQSAAMNRNVNDVLGNFESMLDARLKRTVLVTDRAINEAFGNLKGFNAEQNAHLIGVQDDIIDELQIQNRLMDKANDTAFLNEQERMQDLNINKRTNVLLEDILEKDDDRVKEEGKSDSKLKGMMSGLLGGLGAGAGLRGLMGGIKTIAKKAFLPAVALAAGVQFIRGWEEAGDDASIREKFNSGMAKTLSSLTFGLVSEQFFKDSLNQIETALSNAWTSFRTNWEKYLQGEIGGSTFAARIISGISGGALSEGQVKTFGQQLSDGAEDIAEQIARGIKEGMIDPLVKSVSEKVGGILKDPKGFFERKVQEIVKKHEDDKAEFEARVKGGENASAVAQDMAERNFVESGNLPLIGGLQKLQKKLLLGFGRGTGLLDTPEEAEAKWQAKQQKLAEQKQRDIKAKERKFTNAFKRLEYNPEAIDRLIAKEKKGADDIQKAWVDNMVRELRRGDAMPKPKGDTTMINNSPVISNTIQDTQTENRITDLSALENFTRTR